VTQDIKLTQEPSEAPTLNLSQTQATNSSSVIESNPITSRIWASFDSDPDDSPFGWWSRAGETYQQLDLEYQRLMKRQSRLQQRQRRPDENEPENEFRHTSNKENKATGAVGSNGQETVGLAKSLTTRMNTSVSSHATWSSPINRRSDKSPAYSLGASHVDANESQLSEYSGIARRRQLRNLCAGLRYHRSESNIHHDVIGSFRSRQSLCKILTLDGSISKSFSWKPYYMCIAGSEVRFVKASSTFSNSNRKSKSAKQLADTALASRNMNSFDLIDDNRFWDGSLNSSRPGLNASDAHSGPVSVASSSYVILPLPGLIWTREEVPQDLPRWRPLAPTSTSGIVRKPSPVPDVMDPFHSGLSEPSDSVTVPAILHSTKSSNNEDSVLQSTIQCYRFAHIDAGVELLFVFPDKNTAMACLTMCEMSGGREASSLDIKMSSDRPQPECPLSISNAKAPILSHSESCDPTVELIKPEVSHSIASVVPTSWPALSGAQFKLTDRRQRRVDRQLIARPDPVTQIADAPAYAVTFSSLDVQTTTVVDMHSRLIGAAATSVGDSQTLPRSASVISNPDASAPVEDKSSQRSNKPRNAAPFLRGFKQWLNRPAYGTTDHQPTSLTQNTESNLESKMSALFADPPDLSDFECPGAVFGAPLENQVPSPDHMCVPVILHALVLGLETHGLQMTGLYRKPGRHRTIAQFVCVVNLVPDDIDLLLRLDAWHEPNALCGLVKHFLRRLPVGLFIPETWEPLASLVDSHHSINPPQLAYLLLSIRVKLRKLASEAFGIRNGHAIQGSMSSPDRSADSNTNFGLTGLSNSPKHGSPVSLRGASDCSSEGTRTVTSATWRWATLCFLIAHIREVVGYRHLNEVSFQCIAICFGPVFFGDSTNLARLNGVLENLFRHWPWLIQGLPLVTQKILESAAQNLETTPPDYTLSEAIEYLAQYESLSNTRVPSPVQFPTIDTDPNEPIMYSSDCSPMPASTDDRMNTRLSLEHSDRVFQAVRPLLNRALTSHAAVGKLGQRSSGTESTFSALQRATSAISSISTPRSANSSRRKTMDTHNIRTIQHVIPVEFRRPKPGRAGLNPKHLEPIRSDLQMGLAEQSHAQSDSSTGLQLTAGGVIPRPSVPTRNYRSNVSIGRSTKSPS
ncbi:Rho GTPase activating protein 21, partial [Fasciola gigantica]